MTAITIRELDPDAWEMFRDLRLAALAAVPGVYGTGLADAQKRTEAVWRRTVRGEHNQSFGLFDDARLIGITSVFRWGDDPSGETAILASSFILPEYRGRDLSRLLYDARLAWLRGRSEFKRVVVGHRLSNEASRRANQHYAFREFRRESHAWPDGAVEDEVFYEMDLVPRVLLIGGSSHVGKSTVAALLGARPGWVSMSTDGMARHPGRPWPVQGQPVKPHVVAHYTRLSPDELIRSVLTHYRNMWPAIRQLIERHARGGERLVLDGSGLLPESVATLDTPGVAAVWLTADDTTFRARMLRESGYDGLDAGGRALVEAFLARTLRYNAIMMVQVRARGLPCLHVPDGVAPDAVAQMALNAARPIGAG